MTSPQSTQHVCRRCSFQPAGQGLLRNKAGAGRQDPPVAGRLASSGLRWVRLVDSKFEGCPVGSLLGRLMSGDSRGRDLLDTQGFQQFGPDIIAVHKCIRTYAHIGRSFEANTRSPAEKACHLNKRHEAGHRKWVLHAAAGSAGGSIRQE